MKHVYYWLIDAETMSLYIEQTSELIMFMSLPHNDSLVEMIKMMTLDIKNYERGFLFYMTNLLQKLSPKFCSILLY